MATPEKVFEASLITKLLKIDVFAHHFDAIGCDGWPDILCLKDNECILIECKYNTLDIRTDQAALHTRLKIRYGFNRIYTVSRMVDHGKKGFYYILVDSCFRDQQFRFGNLDELSAALAKEIKNGG